MSNHGFYPSIQLEEHKMLGSANCLPTETILMPQGHGWGAYLPPDTLQNKNGVETEACRFFALLHAIAIVGKKKFADKGFQNLLSARFNALFDPGAGDPHTAAEIIRKNGWVPEVFFPFDEKITTFSQYYFPLPPPANLISIAKDVLKKYSFTHEWVFNDSDPIEMKHAAMKIALQFSPLTVASFAWSQHSDGLYYKDGGDDHYFVVYEFVEGKYWLAFDSYDKTVKELEWSTNFDQCKRIHLELNTGPIGDAPLGIIQTVTGFFKNFFGGIIDGYEKESGEKNNQ